MFSPILVLQREYTDAAQGIIYKKQEIQYIRSKMQAFANSTATCKIRDDLRDANNELMAKLDNMFSQKQQLKARSLQNDVYFIRKISVMYDKKITASENTIYTSKRSYIYLPHCKK